MGSGRLDACFLVLTPGSNFLESFRPNGLQSADFDFLCWDFCESGGESKKQDFSRYFAGGARGCRGLLFFIVLGMFRAELGPSGMKKA